MPSPLHQRILELLRAQPQIVLELLATVEPDHREFWLGRAWVARVQDPSLLALGMHEADADRLADLLITLHPEDDPDGHPTVVLVVECQLAPDPNKLFVWVDYLAAARREHRCAGRLVVLSPVDAVIAWAEGLFADEPWLMPRLIGRAQVPRIEDHGRALREPELAVLSAVFHAPHDGGREVVLAAALALRTMPTHRRYKYIAVLEDVLPEDMMNELRRISLEEAEAAADDWMRTRGPYVIGHREGVQEGREEGREEGLLRGRREALAWILEARGLTPDPTQLARIAAADLPTLERWCSRAKTAHAAEEIFD